MGEDGARPGEASRRQWFRMRRGIFALQCLGKDALHAAHVDEVHIQGPAAGGVQTLRRVPLAQTTSLCPCLTLAQGRGPSKRRSAKAATAGPCSAALRLMRSGARRV